MNKYQKALNSLKELTEEWLDKELQLAENMDEPITFKHQSDINVLQELLDNPPLKFEELKEGMWVWDNIDKVYFQIIKCSDEETRIIIARYNVERYYSETENIKFEENRLYRKEVIK